MVRRLKEDIREIEGGFPKREVCQEDIKNLPANAPELALSTLLHQYRQVRQSRMEGLSKRKQAEHGLLISYLQQGLLSPIEAFARTALAPPTNCYLRGLWLSGVFTARASVRRERSLRHPDLHWIVRC